VKYRFHPEAALEHEEQAAYYEARAAGLGARYHAAFRSAVLRACEAPHRYKVVIAPAVRRASIRGFPFSIYVREAGGALEVLAIAHHRRRPGYWAGRL
jgi:toxin ParE1/3/4